MSLPPQQDHPKRYIFNHFHHNSGRLAIAFGIANVYLGLHLADVRSGRLSSVLHPLRHCQHQGSSDKCLANELHALVRWSCAEPPATV